MPMQRPPQPYTLDEAIHIQKHLDLKLDSSHLSYRPAAQGAVAYLEGWKAFNLANEVFGFNGWSSEILSLTTDFCETDSSGKVSLGMSCMVRIHLRDGTFHDDIGYGSSENQRSKAAAYEKARKEAVTDAMKRALRIFGNRLGNCAYDKIFLKEVKTRPAGSTNNIVRAANYPAKAEPDAVQVQAQSVQRAPVQVQVPVPPQVPVPVQKVQPQQYQPPQPQVQEIIFDDSIFENSMMISEDDFIFDDAEFDPNENIPPAQPPANANAQSFSSSGIYPLPARPMK